MSSTGIKTDIYDNLEADIIDVKLLLMTHYL